MFEMISKIFFNDCIIIFNSIFIFSIIEHLNVLGVYFVFTYFLFRLLKYLKKNLFVTSLLYEKLYLTQALLLKVTAQSNLICQKRAPLQSMFPFWSKFSLFTYMKLWAFLSMQIFFQNHSFVYINVKCYKQKYRVDMLNHLIFEMILKDFCSYKRHNWLF